MASGIANRVSAPCRPATGQRGAFPGHSGAQLPIDWTPAGRELSRELRRRESKAGLILARLREGPACTEELATIGGIRFSARLHELEARGFAYEREDHLDYSIYTMIREPK